MPFEAPPKSNIPWMVQAELDIWIKFKVDQQSLDGPKENEKGWSCYTADMEFPGSEFKTDNHEIPFWAMEAMFDAYVEADKAKGYVTYRYKRIEDSGTKKNKAVIQVFD